MYYLPPTRLTSADWYPATYTNPKSGATIKVMATNTMTRYIDGHTYTWCRVTQRTNVPGTYKTGDRLFMADRNLSPRTP